MVPPVWYSWYGWWTPACAVCWLLRWPCRDLPLPVHLGPVPEVPTPRPCVLGGRRPFASELQSGFQGHPALPQGGLQSGVWSTAGLCALGALGPRHPLVAVPRIVPLALSHSRNSSLEARGCVVKVWAQVTAGTGPRAPVKCPTWHLSPPLLSLQAEGCPAGEHRPGALTRNAALRVLLVGPRLM